MKVEPTLQLRVEEFCQRLEEMYRIDHGINDYLFQTRFHPKYGTKNIKIVKTEKGQGGSVYCFIETATGDILKAAGWKAPAAGKRGSIWNDDCDVGTDKPANMYGSGLYIR